MDDVVEALQAAVETGRTDIIKYILETQGKLWNHSFKEQLNVTKQCRLVLGVNQLFWFKFSWVILNNCQSINLVCLRLVARVLVNWPFKKVYETSKINYG